VAEQYDISAQSISEATEQAKKIDPTSNITDRDVKNFTCIWIIYNFLVKLSYYSLHVSKDPIHWV